MITTQEFRNYAEQYIDNSSVSNAIEEIAEICRLKAEHLRVNWQDEASARQWDSAAKAIETAAMRKSVLRVSGFDV